MEIKMILMVVKIHVSSKSVEIISLQKVRNVMMATQNRMMDVQVFAELKNRLVFVVTKSLNLRRNVTMETSRTMTAVINARLHMIVETDSENQEKTVTME